MAKGYEVIVPSLNIRSGPGVDYEDLGDLNQGDLAMAPDGWVPIVMADGTIGWIAEKFTKPADVVVDNGATTPSKPPQPAQVPPGKVIYQSQLSSLFGAPKDPAPYLKVMDFKEFKSAFSHVRDYLGNPWSCRIYGHELMEAPLRQAFRNLVDRGYAGEWRTFDGCHNIRPITGGTKPSTHAWGMAVDLNAGSNGRGSRPTLSSGFVQCFTDAGFEWGGKWRTPDGMHFQLPRTS